MRSDPCQQTWLHCPWCTTHNPQGSTMLLGSQTGSISQHSWVTLLWRCLAATLWCCRHLWLRWLGTMWWGRVSTGSQFCCCPDAGDRRWQRWLPRWCPQSHLQVISMFAFMQICVMQPWWCSTADNVIGMLMAATTYSLSLQWCTHVCYPNHEAYQLLMPTMTSAQRFGNKAVFRAWQAATCIKTWHSLTHPSCKTWRCMQSFVMC